MSLERRLAKLEQAIAARGEGQRCPDPWHSTAAAGLVIVVEGRETIPTCPTCHAEPARVVIIARLEAPP